MPAHDFRVATHQEDCGSPARRAQPRQVLGCHRGKQLGVLLDGVDRGDGRRTNCCWLARDASVVPPVPTSSRRKVLGASACVVGLLASPVLAAPPGGKPEVVLNHLSVVLDAATAHDVATNGFLKDTFASVSQKANVSNDGKHWTGTYVYGERTYLEAYEAGPAQGEPGSSGIAFGVEHQGDVARLVLPLADAGGEATVVLRTVQGPKSAQVPWFYQLRVFYRTDPPSNTSRWVMEYQKDFLRTVEPGKDGISRAQMAARFQEKNRLVKDIVGATVALSDREMERFLKELQVYGWAVRSEGQKHVTAGPGVTLTLIPSTPTVKGLTEVRFQLVKKGVPPQTLHLGPTSILSVASDGTAVWAL
jgi:hypothetical protein